MKLKKYISIAAAVLSIAAFSSCKKEGLPFFRGTYGFVTSGNVSCVCMDDGASADPFDCQLLPERGIMRIEGDDIGTILTMSTIAGEALVFPVRIEGTDITLEPQKRMINLNVDSYNVAVPVTVQGHGHKTDGIIVLTLEYKSAVFTVEGSRESHSYMIKDSNVRCVASVQE